MDRTGVLCGSLGKLHLHPQPHGFEQIIKAGIAAAIILQSIQPALQRPRLGLAARALQQPQLERLEPVDQPMPRPQRPPSPRLNAAHRQARRGSGGNAGGGLKRRQAKHFATTGDLRRPGHRLQGKPGVDTHTITTITTCTYRTIVW